VGHLSGIGSGDLRGQLVHALCSALQKSGLVTYAYASLAALVDAHTTLRAGGWVVELVSELGKATLSVCFSSQQTWRSLTISALWRSLLNAGAL